MLEEMEAVIDTDIYESSSIGGTGGKVDQLKSILTRRKKNVLDEMFEDDDFGLGDKKKEIDQFFIDEGFQMKQ